MTMRRFWNAIVVAGTALSGCATSVTPPPQPLSTLDLSASVDMQTPSDLATADLHCNPDLSLANGTTDAAFDRDKGCLPGFHPSGTPGVCGDECGNCVPCFI